MLGNCATGKVRMVSVPTITKIMETTIATMGRLMKNFDIGLSVLVFRAERLGIHECASAHFLHAFRDDLFSGMQPVRDNPLGTDTIADRYRTNADFVVAAYHRNLVAALKF